jgi:hypothetical protein
MACTLRQLGLSIRISKMWKNNSNVDGKKKLSVGWEEQVECWMGRIGCEVKVRKERGLF